MKKSVISAVSEVKRLFRSPFSIMMVLSGFLTAVLSYTNESYKGNDPAMIPYVIGFLVGLVIVSYIMGEQN